MSVIRAERLTVTQGASQVCGAQMKNSSVKNAEGQQTSEMLLEYFSSINTNYLHCN